jgi:hypothetical protein
MAPLGSLSVSHGDILAAARGPRQLVHRQTHGDMRASGDQGEAGCGPNAFACA